MVAAPRAPASASGPPRPVRPRACRAAAVAGNRRRPRSRHRRDSSLRQAERVPAGLPRGEAGRGPAEMGESVSKRLKLQLGGEAEMEERAFANPYPDYQPQGAAAAHGAAEAQRDRALLPPAAEDALPFGADGKVRAGREPLCAPPGLLPVRAARGLLAGRAGRRARTRGCLPRNGCRSPAVPPAALPSSAREVCVGERRCGAAPRRPLAARRRRSRPALSKEGLRTGGRQRCSRFGYRWALPFSGNS